MNPKDKSLVKVKRMGKPTVIIIDAEIVDDESTVYSTPELTGWQKFTRWIGDAQDKHLARIGLSRTSVSKGVLPPPLPSTGTAISLVTGALPPPPAPAVPPTVPPTGGTPPPPPAPTPVPPSATPPVAPTKAWWKTVALMAVITLVVLVGLIIYVNRGSNDTDQASEQTAPTAYDAAVVAPASPREPSRAEPKYDFILDPSVNPKDYVGGSLQVEKFVFAGNGKRFQTPRGWDSVCTVWSSSTNDFKRMANLSTLEEPNWVEWGASNAIGTNKPVITGYWVKYTGSEELPKEGMKVVFTLTPRK